MASSQQYGWIESDVGVVLPSAREVEEGELSDGIPSSDEDVSPRSLVIDAQDNEEQIGKGRQGIMMFMKFKVWLGNQKKWTCFYYKFNECFLQLK